MPRKLPPYKCPRCAYETGLKCHMVKHFFELKKPCPIVADSVELTDDVKRYVLANRVFRRDALPTSSLSSPPPAAPAPPANPVDVPRKVLTLPANSVYKKTASRREHFLQMVVEAFLGGQHMTLENGVTDVTNDTTHAEIKEWREWKTAVGQLDVYNTECPRQNLHMYLFGERSEQRKQMCVNILNRRGIKAFTFDMTSNVVEIVDADHGHVVFVCALEFRDP